MINAVYGVAVVLISVIFGWLVVRRIMVASEVNDERYQESRKVQSEANEILRGLMRSRMGSTGFESRISANLDLMETIRSLVFFLACFGVGGVLLFHHSSLIYSDVDVQGVGVLLFFGQIFCFGMSIASVFANYVKWRSECK